MKTRRQTATTNFNVLMILSLAFIALCLFVPVWQSSISSSLTRSLRRAEAELETITEQKMTLQASVAEKNTPEYVLGQSGVINLAFARIPADSKTVVASSL